MINNINKILSIIGINQQQPNHTQQQPSAPASSNNVEITNKLDGLIAQLVQQGEPAPNQQRILEIRQAIESGQYKIDEKTLASNLVNEYFPTNKE